MTLFLELLLIWFGAAVVLAMIIGLIIKRRGSPR